MAGPICSAWLASSRARSHTLLQTSRSTSERCKTGGWSLSKPPGEGSFAIASSVGFTGDGDLTFGSDSDLASPGAGLSAPRTLTLSKIEADLVENLGLSLILPIRLKDETVAFAWLGRKLSGGEYDTRDHEYLVGVAEQASDGFDRIRLHLMERELEAGKRQRQLLPREPPHRVCESRQFVTGPRRGRHTTTRHL